MTDVPAVDDRAAYAGFWQRVAAFTIDYLLVLVGSASLGAVAQIAGVVGDDPRQLSLIALVTYFLYCTLLESSPLQATAGKRALGLKVTSRHGERIGFARAALRFLTKLLSALTLCLGFLLVVVTKRRQALHDLVAGTLVAHDGTPRRPASVVAAFAMLACVPALVVLAAVAVPAYQDFAIRAQVGEGLELAARYRQALEAEWRNAPRDFADLSVGSIDGALPRSGRYVESIDVVSGMIVITYGAEASKALDGSVLTIVPALDAAGTLGWICAYGEPPVGFESVFEGPAGYTDIAQRFIPTACRSTEP